MMHSNRLFVSGVLVAVLLWASLPAWSETDSLSSWVEACDATDSDLVQLLKNELLLVDVDSVTLNGDGTYSVTSEAYTYAWPYYYGAGKTLCEDSVFYGQLRVETPISEVSPDVFRSAVQVGRRSVVTAWHNTVNGITPDLYAIFGLQHHTVDGVCTEPDFEHVPAANVFLVTDVIYDGCAPGPTCPEDFLVLQLDRNVSSTYPRIRRTGQGQVGDRITHISHPEKLPAKVDLEGSLSSNSATGPVVTNTHSLVFSSGGMFYDRDEKFLETVNKSYTNTHLVQDPVLGCWRVEELGSSSQPNISIRYIADHIPPFELLVTTLDTVSHDCSLTTGSCTNATTNRTISAPSPGSSIAYQIAQPAGTPPQLVATFTGPLSGTLTPGSSFSSTETINLTGATAGTYVRTYTVSDVTHGFSDVVRHVITVSP